MMITIVLHGCETYLNISYEAIFVGRLFENRVLRARTRTVRYNTRIARNSDEDNDELYDSQT